MRLKMLLAVIAGLFTIHTAAAQEATEATPAPAATTAPPVDPANILDLELSTGGTVKILLRPDKAPHSVERVRMLANRGFYDGLIFHRVIEGFMAQTGDPNGDGTGGSDLPNLKAEFNDLPHVRGVMSMARAQDEDSANSQFFIMLSPNLRLDRKYTAVGRVISGMQYVDAIERGEPPANPSKIIRARTEAEAPTLPVAESAPAAPAAASDRDKETERAIESVLHGELKDETKPKQ